MAKEAVGRRRRAGIAEDRRGVVLATLALLLLVLLASAGLAIDLGRGYVEKLLLGRAVDAGALAAARMLRDGEAAARTEAEAVARANRVGEGIGDIDTSISFGMNERGEGMVTFSADRTIPTTFMGVLGFQRMRVRSSAVAAVPPVDIVLVLDTSGSLGAAGAWTDLQHAAQDFVRNFDDDLDQVGLVSFQITAHERVMLGHDFTVPIVDDIDAMSSAGDTNIAEGLRLARLQMESAAARPSAAKVVVFFTDGRATALRGVMGNGVVPPADRVLATYSNSNVLRGYFDDPPSIPPFSPASPDGCENLNSCFGQDGNQLRQAAAAAGSAEADLIRADDVLIYVIALGNQSYPPGDMRLPDLDYLRGIANEDGVSDPEQPEGKMYFAPNPFELRAVFNEVARDLIVRLAG
jgi:Flp pilus assembly protein TadG